MTIERRVSSRPSHIRTTPLVHRNPRPFSEKSLRAIAALNKGLTLGAVSREAGMAKENVRIIRLRARRRGLLNAKAIEVMDRGANQIQRLLTAGKSVF